MCSVSLNLMGSKQPERPQAVQLTLRPLARDAPPMVRLRIALKVLLRCFGLKCAAIEEMPIPETTMTQAATRRLGAGITMLRRHET
jgi:hypothetical protein